jgi:glutaredoxin
MSEVIIYTKPGCPYCDSAKEHYTKEGIPFKEIDVYDVPGAKEVWCKSGIGLYGYKIGRDLF